jgi:hypothetical protein
MSITTKLESAKQEFLGSYVSDVDQCRDVLSRTSTRVSPGAFALGVSDNPGGDSSPLLLFMRDNFDDNEFRDCVVQLIVFFSTEGYEARAALVSRYRYQQNSQLVINLRREPSTFW